MPAAKNNSAAAAVKAGAHCPQCKRLLGAEAEPRWRPFCSERCKLADLGQWFAGRYSIPADEDEPETTPDQEPRQ